MVGINEMVDTLHELLATALEANLSLISVSQNKGTKRLAGLGPDHPRAYGDRWHWLECDGLKYGDYPIARRRELGKDVP